MMREMSTPNSTRQALLPPINSPQSVRRRNWRVAKDIAARYGVAIGGSAVIAFLVLIFVYLFYVVVPLFKGASVESAATYALPAPEAGVTRALALDEQLHVGVRYTDQAHAVFFTASSGELLETVAIAPPGNGVVTSFGNAELASGAVFYGLNNGYAWVAKADYTTDFSGQEKRIIPSIAYPLGEQALQIDGKGEPLKAIAGHLAEKKATVAAITADNRIVVARFSQSKNALTGKASWQRKSATLLVPGREPTQVVIDTDQKELYVVTRDGEIYYYDVQNISRPVLVQHVFVAKPDEITAVNFLPGGTSLMIATRNGEVVQYFPVRENRNTTLREIRRFQVDEKPISLIAPEYFRRSFAVVDDGGNMKLYHATAERHLLTVPLAGLPKAIVFAPRANALLMQTSNDQIQLWHVHNEHPEVSWKSLWGKVWYEGYTEPHHIWQSTSANSDFEPKLSLTPIAFGTLKAAFYALMFAIPLSVLGAIYTAYFMAPAMRRMVKPLVEIMAALPSVILGFLAGLWLAPLVEHHLPAFFLMLWLAPVVVALFAYGWAQLPDRARVAVPDGWQAALLIPVLIAAGALCFMLSPWIETQFLGGDVRQWLTNDMGINFDQRNSLIVGIAMGFAVIPTIFSIAEDAIFGVPKHLTLGSLALGATPWQTLARVVLLTASPGIFSAVMVGLGRAVGETMIVLMATGNTPVMDFSIFQGMRTLAANVAVEMPESEVGSTHYRVLFLAALVLFLFTFLFNTIAEVVRQNLRKKYSSL
jgi:phosphate transport system permease protein